MAQDAVGDMRHNRHIGHDLNLVNLRSSEDGDSCKDLEAAEDIRGWPWERPLDLHKLNVSGQLIDM